MVVLVGRMFVLKREPSPPDKTRGVGARAGQIIVLNT